MKMYCLVNDFKKKTTEIEENIKGVKEIKANKDMIIEIVKDLEKKIVMRATELQEYKLEVQNQFIEKGKSINRIDQAIENKAEKMVIFEIKDELREKINKKELQELEDKVFPLMGDVVVKTKIFDEKIEETRRQMMRFDEVIMDKASKYDIVNITKKLELCLEKCEFDNFTNVQKVKISEIETKMSNLSADVFEKGQFIEGNTF